jgi:predicted nucleic acid-binding protein
MHIVLWWEFVHCLIIGSFFMGERKMKRRKKMNTKKFKVFVEALESLPEHIRNNKVDMHLKE